MRQGNAVIIEDADGNYLLHLRDERAPTLKDQWSLVGGRAKNGETLEQTAMREAKEETNLDVCDMRPVSRFVVGSEMHVQVFHARVNGDRAKMKCCEGKQCKFFSPADARELIASLSYSNPYLESFIQFLDAREK